MEYKEIRRILISLIMIAIILVIILSVINLSTGKKSKKVEEKESENISNNLDDSSSEENIITAHEDDLPSQYEATSEILKVNNRNKYFAIKTIIEEFFSDIKYLNYNETDNSNNRKERSINSINGKLYEKYKEEYGISENNIESIYRKYANQEYNIEKMYIAEKTESINIFFVYGRFLNTNEEYNFIVITDSINNTFAIIGNDYLEANNYTEERIKNLNVEEIKINIDKIEQNQYNSFNYTNIPDEALIKIMLSEYKNEMLEYAEYAYKKIYTSYKDARFEDIDEFKQYIEENYENIKNATLEKYNVTKYDKYTEYLCVDQNGKNYIFLETSVMNYKVLLDNYTILMPNYVAMYNAELYKGKCEYCLQRIESALNDKNYSFIYNVLNEEFREIYFPQREKLEEFMQENFYETNEIRFNNISVEENNTYTYTTYIVNSQTKEYKNVIFRIKLKEGTGFEIEFSIE